MRPEQAIPTRGRSTCNTAGEFKDSPVGRIPQDWDVRTIAETAAPVANSFTDGDWIETPHIRQQGIRLVQTGNIGVGEFLDKPEDRKFISKDSFAALRCKPLHPGDVLICRLADPVGRACLLPDDIGAAITSVDVTIYRSNPELLRQQFAMWQLNTHAALNRCDLLAGGTTRKRISRLNLGRLPIAVPKIEEQIAIDTVLDTVDKAIAKTEAVIAKLKQVRAGLLHDLLTRGLDENGQLRDPVAHPEQFQGSSLGRIPRNWEIRTCQSLCREIVVGIVVKPASYYVDHGIPALRSANIREDGITSTDLVFISPQSNAELDKSILRAGDVVTVRTGYPGTTCVVPRHLDGANCVDLIISRPNKEILPEYLARWVNSPFGKDQVLRVQGGLAQQHFNVGEMKSLLVAKPDKQEQSEIGCRIAEMDALRKRESETFLKLGLLKSGLMDDLLTGRVRVPEGIVVRG